MLQKIKKFLFPPPKLTGRIFSPYLNHKPLDRPDNKPSEGIGWHHASFTDPIRPGDHVILPMRSGRHAKFLVLKASKPTYPNGSDNFGEVYQDYKAQAIEYV